MSAVAAPAPWPTARTIAHRAGTPGRPETVPLEHAAGRVLAACLRAGTALPPFASSAMDGWAACGTGPWRVVNAGTPLRPGEAVRIATGAAIPPGADGVVRREDGIEADATLWTPDLLRPAAQDIRPAGEEADTGDVLAPTGAVITPPLVGLAAMAGHDALSVRRRPTVGIVILGDELLTTGPARDGRVRDALGVQLPAWVGWYGGTVTSHTRRPGDLDATIDALGTTEADVVVTTGGSSIGCRDHVRAAVVALGGHLLVDQVAVRPGHPMLLADLPGRRRLVALPGNPGAAVVAVLTLLEPLLSGLSGRPLTAPRRSTMTRAVRAGSHHRVVPATDDGTWATPCSATGAAMLSGWAAASSAVIVPPGGAAPGTRVDAMPLPWAALADAAPDHTAPVRTAPGRIR